MGQHRVMPPHRDTIAPRDPARLRSLLAWSPSPVVRASLGLHAGGLLALAAEPAAWPEVLGLLAANHAGLAGCMHPRCGLLGPNLTRLPGAPPRVALTFDDGPDPEVTPRVLDLLDAAGARASFFVLGEAAARQGPLLREMLRRGHGIENHTHRHPLGFATWGPGAMLAEIETAQRAIADACGQAPRLFRPPAGLRSPLLDPVLALASLSLVSWTRRGYDTVSSRPERVLARLLRGLAPGDVLLLHDGRLGRRQGQPSVALALLPRLLAALAAAGLSAASLDEAPVADATAAPAGAAASPGSAAYASR
ncbi:polysaccharide deacetylase family protein [Belnapia sp. T6]|uniref:Chitooligosaccharide deacetylase n=1 Tax=Belnapia mucosa TaxID=2804532 RepID=A0ABS1V5U8_9PROT|nr:polysaccharide deacetylase family protein [Belnapia mucosa]MBL6457052.1 polysaccharide deacetylase family protein [Belnapia mucosa]